MRALIYVLAVLTGTASLVAVQQPSTPATAPAPASPPSASAPAQAPGANSNSPAPRPQAAVDENVQYGEVQGQKLLLDVYHPADGAAPGGAARLHPAVILIHGGGWTSFDKSTMRGMGQVLARAGYVAFSVDYRLFHGPAARFPAQLDDMQRAVRWVRAHADQYHVDRDHIGAFGHSAGAQLAALLGMEDARDNSDAALAAYSSRVQAVVDVSGPADLTSNRDPDGDAFLTQFLGVEYTKNPQAWRDASPIFHVAKSNAPFLIVHGARDANVPIAQSEALAASLREAGVPVNLVRVDGEHTFQTPEARRRLAIETLEFFNRYLKVN